MYKFQKDKKVLNETNTSFFQVLKFSIFLGETPSREKLLGIGIERVEILFYRRPYQVHSPSFLIDGVVIERKCTLLREKGDPPPLSHVPVTLVLSVIQ